MLSHEVRGIYCFGHGLRGERRVLTVMIDLRFCFDLGIGIGLGIGVGIEVGLGAEVEFEFEFESDRPVPAGFALLERLCSHSFRSVSKLLFPRLCQVEEPLNRTLLSDCIGLTA